MVIGIHPNNVENNLEGLETGRINIYWKWIKDNYLDGKVK